MPQGKFFYIKSKLNGLVLDVKGGSAEPGTEVVTWSKNEDSEAPNQIWVEDHLTGCIRSSLDEDMCLTISDDNFLVVEHYNGPGDQHWITAGDRIQHRADSDKVLDIMENNSDEGARVGAWGYHGADNQLWEFEYLEARLFHIISELNGKYLTCKDHKLKMYPLDGYGDANQVWHEDKHGLIYCHANHLTLSSKKGLGKKMKLDDFQPGEECQMWCRSGNKIINRTQPSNVLDINAADTSDGAKVIAWEYKDQENQHWKFSYL